MIDFSIKVEDGSINVILDKLTTGILSSIQKEIGMQSQLLGDFMRTNYLTGGPSESKLAVRTGLLRKSLNVMPITKTADGVSGGIEVGAGVPYSRVHINRLGTVTTIKAKGKFLAIPLGPARTTGGASKRAGALSWGKGEGGLFPLKSKSGGMLLVKSVGTQIIPYFSLVQSVRVRARVDPWAILKIRERKIVQGLKDAIISGGLSG